MAKVNQVSKKVKMELAEVVKFQLLTYCHLKNITVSQADLSCLTFLAIEGQNEELTSFCIKAHNMNIFSSVQSVRNCLTKAEKKGLVAKEGKNKKHIYIHPDVDVVTKGNILLDYKFLYVES